MVRKRILVVDDSHDAADMLVDLVSLWGHEARAVYSGEDAVGVALDWRPDVMLLDIGLPDLSGYAVARRVRDAGAASVVRLVALTGYGEPEDRQQVKDAGFDYHLVKPVDVNALERLLEA